VRLPAVEPSSAVKWKSGESTCTRPPMRPHLPSCAQAGKQNPLPRECGFISCQVLKQGNRILFPDDEPSSAAKFISLHVPLLAAALRRFSTSSCHLVAKSGNCMHCKRGAPSIFDILMPSGGEKVEPTCTASAGARALQARRRPTASHFLSLYHISLYSPRTASPAPAHRKRRGARAPGLQ
jgi:hypothetical protein